MSDATTLLLTDYLRTLKMPTMLREYPVVARQSSEQDASYDQFLAQLAELEVQHRHSQAINPRDTPCSTIACVRVNPSDSSASGPGSGRNSWITNWYWLGVKPEISRTLRPPTALEIAEVVAILGTSLFGGAAVRAAGKITLRGALKLPAGKLSTQLLVTLLESRGVQVVFRTEQHVVKGNRVVTGTFSPFTASGSLKPKVEVFSGSPNKVATLFEEYIHFVQWEAIKKTLPTKYITQEVWEQVILTRTAAAAKAREVLHTLI